MKQSKKLTALMAGLMMMATAATANALTLSVSTDESNWVTVEDNGALDMNSIEGLINFANTTSTGFSVVSVAGNSVSTAQGGELYMNSFETSGPIGGTLYLKLTEAFTYGTWNRGAVATTGLTMQRGSAEVDLETFYTMSDTTTLIADIDLTAPGFIGNTTNLASLSAPYALTEYLTIHNLNDVSSQITASLQVTPVPEPGTMALVGLGMIGLAVYGKRRTGNREMLAQS